MTVVVLSITTEAESVNSLSLRYSLILSTSKWTTVACASPLKLVLKINSWQNPAPTRRPIPNIPALPFLVDEDTSSNVDSAVFTLIPQPLSWIVISLLEIFIVTNPSLRF